MLPQDLIFDNSSGLFEVHSIETQHENVVLIALSKQNKNRCPDCRQYSRLIHGYYFRTVKDLPILGYSVVIKLRVRKFYCRNDRCSRKVFAEQFPDPFQPYRRTTVRLDDKLLKIALLMGGNPGKKLCDTLNIETSSSSLIRRIHGRDLKSTSKPTHIGIDDWAYKKGHTYGTVIIDLKKRKIIDLLPDRETYTVETWLKKRSDVKIVTRDRYAKYARGITNGAPAANQVADRWHLIKNMGDAVKRLLERKKQELRRQEIADAAKAIKKPVIFNNNESESNCNDKSILYSKFQEIKKLHSNGIPIKRICRIVEVS